MSVTRVANATNAYSAAANTRLGDGIRATASSQSFSPILESSAAANVGAQDQGLRNDDWGDSSAGKRRGASGNGPRSPIRLGSVLTSNEFSQALFEMGSREAERRGIPRGTASRSGTGVYETNMRVIAARAAGERLTGGTINRYS